MRTLFDRFREIEFPTEDYAIFGSGPLAIRNIISAPNDLDVLCRGTARDRARQIGRERHLSKINVTVVDLPRHKHHLW